MRVSISGMGAGGWFPGGSRGDHTQRDVKSILARHRSAQLCEAASQGSEEQVTDLLSANANPNCPDEGGRLPLHAAVVAGAAPVVQLLVGARADANIEQGDDRPLQIAAWYGHTEVVRKLLEAGASVNAANGRGATPLCSAAAQGRVQTVQVLLRHSADPGKTAQLAAGRPPTAPLQAAVTAGHRQVVEVLKAEAPRAGPRPRANSIVGDGCCAGIAS